MPEFSVLIGMTVAIRKLGSSDLQVAPIMLGGNVFGWTADEETSFRILDAFVDAGFNFIDTADMYSTWIPGHTGGESETIIGRWLTRSKKREQVVLATKVGKEVPGSGEGLSRQRILHCAEDSLRRMQTDYIDLYQSHDDDEKTPLAETLEAYGELMKEGKVRFIGASNYGAARLDEALRLAEQGAQPAYVSLQPSYNLYDRSDYETDLEALVKKKGLGVIPYASLASGFLTGKYRSEEDLEGRERGSKVSKYLNERGFRILETLDEIAKRLNATPAQVSLAWLMARPGITAPIASATSVEQLSEILGSTDVKLEQSDIVDLDSASSEVSGQAAVWARQN